MINNHQRLAELRARRQENQTMRRFVGGGVSALTDYEIEVTLCTSTSDVTDLTGTHAERWMEWASCFELDFTFIHEGPVRKSGPSRYRHWLTHKLSSWHDQFGTSGCVGCGRCIAWCPTGIDITEEMAAFALERDGD